MTEDPRIGSILNDRYQILDRIAAGGMAVVYRGERLELGRPVAIKFLQEVMLQNPKFISRFEAEAKAMSKLSHPYCVSVIDFGVEGAPYIVMDFVEGETLKALLKKERVSVSRAITLTRQILAGIAHAHSQGIVHRDIKPENIMLQEVVGVGEQVRIFDFGLAKLLDHNAGMSMEHSSLVAGTPNYMSPEQSRGGKIDERTDLYSICVVFFELLTGRKPFIHNDFLEVVRMHRETVPPTINDVSEELQFSEALQALVAKALSKDPAARFQTAEAFSAALDATPEGIRAKELEASVKPDPKAKTLPVGTMTPFHFPVARESFAPTTTLKPEASDIPEATDVPASPMPAEASKKMSAIPRWALPVGAVGMLALVLLFLLWPEGESATDAEGGKKSVAARTQQSEETATGKKKETASSVKSAGAESSSGKTGGEKSVLPSPSVVDADTQPETEAELQVVVTSIADAKQLLDEGKQDAAIKGLQKLRREQPQKANIVYMLANIYYEKSWINDALDHYREAIRLDAGYRNRAVLIRNVISAMQYEKAGRKAMTLLSRNVGKPALPQLRKAAKKDKNPIVKRRAAAVIKKIKGK